MDCPANSYSSSVSTSCICDVNNNVFSVVGGVAICCPAESTVDPLGGGCICSNPQRTFDSATSACFCPANDYANFTASNVGVTTVECLACPADTYNPPTNANRCVCNPGLVERSVQESTLDCLVCPSGSTESTDQDNCRCHSALEFYDIDVNSCRSCPVGTFADPFDFQGCICDSSNQYFGSSSGTS